jgi:acetoin utilization deacetylase AcuC-like enzyme
LGIESVLLLTDPRMVDHDTGRAHPESSARLRAVLDSLGPARAEGLVRDVAPVPAEISDLLRAHQPELVDLVRDRCASGEPLDPDTPTSAGSWEAATLAAGAGLTAVAQLRDGDARAAFCAVRPPGHHATPTRAMGFCLLNNVAVTAAALADAGERVVILDIDAHHGNGTQDVFLNDPRVLFVSWHQWPLYPGTGRVEDTGGPGAEGTTINVPLPRGSTGDRYLEAYDRVVDPVIDAFDPTWVLLSVGFDAHRDDPLTDLGLSAGDYGALVARSAALRPGRTIAFLEGGYSLEAIRRCAALVVPSLAGELVRGEPPTGGGPGAEAVAWLVEHWHRAGLLAS